MRFFILFIFFITNALSKDVSEIKNIVIHKDPKTLDNVIFLDKKDEKINIKSFNGKTNRLSNKLDAGWFCSRRDEH